MPKIEEYLDKNTEQFTQLNALIKTGDIHLLVASAELFVLLNNIEGNVIEDEQFSKYKGVQVLMHPYLPSGALLITRKSEAIKFTLTCLCGIWTDQPHP